MKSILLLMRLAVLAGAVAFLSGQSIAQEEKSEPPAKLELKSVDADSNGTVTLDELKEYLLENHLGDWAAKFEAEDASEDERKKMFVDKYLDAWAQKIDANENGTISKWELRLAFKSLDQVMLEQAETDKRELEEARNKPPASSIELMNLRFQSQKPSVGTQVDHLVAVGEDGEEVDFAELHDKHVVIVFGCLT